VLTSDSGISKWMTDGITVWEADIVKLFHDHFPVEGTIFVPPHRKSLRQSAGE
jgi:hypothetical protein